MLTAPSALLLPPRRTVHRLFGRPVEVWLARIRPRTPVASAGAAPELTAQERDTLDAIGDGLHRLQHAGGRVLVRRVLGAELGVPPRRVPLARGAGGRPCLDPGAPGARAPYDFNISHSGPYVALAVTSGMRVGVDIERLAARDASAALARRLFTPHERTLLTRPGSPRHLARWYRIWTTREAHAKARGAGVGGLRDPMTGHGTRWQRGHVALAGPYTGSVVALRPGSFDPPTREVTP
ncbi:4'-phosphopantetheinyl transferase family protein [Streptomyces sp. NPDC002067]